MTPSPSKHPDDPSHSSPNKPIQHVRRGGVQAAIWKNAGQRGPYYSVTIDKRYRDEQGEWQTSYAFGRDQLLVDSRVAELAFHAIHEMQRTDREQEEQAGADRLRGRSAPPAPPPHSAPPQRSSGSSSGSAQSGRSRSR